MQQQRQPHTLRPWRAAGGRGHAQPRARRAQVGLGWSAAVGSGLVVARQPGGGWTPPSALAFYALGWGFQCGGSLCDLLLVLRSRYGLAHDLSSPCPTSTARGAAKWWPALLAATGLRLSLHAGKPSRPSALGCSAALGRRALWLWAPQAGRQTPACKLGPPAAPCSTATLCPAASLQARCPCRSACPAVLSCTHHREVQAIRVLVQHPTRPAQLPCRCLCGGVRHAHEGRAQPRILWPSPHRPAVVATEPQRAAGTGTHICGALPFCSPGRSGCPGDQAGPSQRVRPTLWKLSLRQTRALGCCLFSHMSGAHLNAYNICRRQHLQQTAEAGTAPAAEATRQPSRAGQGDPPAQPDTADCAGHGQSGDAGGTSTNDSGLYSSLYEPSSPTAPASYSRPQREALSDDDESCIGVDLFD